MTLGASVRAVAGASGDGAVDWAAVERAASAAVSPGDVRLSSAERDAYAADVRAARDAIRPVAGLAFDVPRTVEIQHRHHWIGAAVDTFERILAPLDDAPVRFPGVTRTVNTATMAAALAYLADHVLGQYDPLLLADGAADHRLYFVHPNVERAAVALDVSRDRFRRWIAFHEVAHAAEFAAAPWLPGYLEDRLRATVTALEAGDLERSSMAELTLAMTAIEGYAELLMDRSFDRPVEDLRERLDARRRGGGPVAGLVRRLLGLELKRRQYERGRAFFDAVAAARGLAGAARVWDDPANLPTEAELEDPSRWLRRVGP
ncbi:MAG: zinc-dependent metalloprotease [Halobacteriaceae archaeon]